MRLPDWLLDRLSQWSSRVALSRPADFIIGGEGDPYLKRWWVIPRNGIFNIYLHRFIRSDDDRALHDHPWFNASIVLSGWYREHRIRAGGVHVTAVRCAGDVVVRSPWAAHRIELLRVAADSPFTSSGLRVSDTAPVWTLFITGPRLRQWGFHCRHGWRHWKVFTASDDPGAIGRGCE